MPKGDAGGTGRGLVRRSPGCSGIEDWRIRTLLSASTTPRDALHPESARARAGSRRGRLRRDADAVCYLRWAERHHYGPPDVYYTLVRPKEAGLKSPRARSRCRTPTARFSVEAGTHRLVRITLFRQPGAAGRQRPPRSGVVPVVDQTRRESTSPADDIRVDVTALRARAEQGRQPTLAVRHHPPALPNIVVSCQNERSSLQNKADRDGRGSGEACSRQAARVASQDVTPLLRRLGGRGVPGAPRSVLRVGTRTDGQGSSAPTSRRQPPSA